MKKVNFGCSEILPDNEFVFWEAHTASFRQFVLGALFLSGISSCYWRSSHTGVFSKLGSLVISVSSSYRSVEKCLLVCSTACSKSQLFSSCANGLGSCPIFIYWTTFFTPTLRSVLSLPRELLGLAGPGPFWS